MTSSRIALYDADSTRIRGVHQCLSAVTAAMRTFSRGCRRTGRSQAEAADHGRDRRALEQVALPVAHVEPIAWRPSPLRQAGARRAGRARAGAGCRRLVEDVEPGTVRDEGADQGRGLRRERTPLVRRSIREMATSARWPRWRRQQDEPHLVRSVARSGSDGVQVAGAGCASARAARAATRRSGRRPRRLGGVVEGAGPVPSGTSGASSSWVRAVLRCPRVHLARGIPGAPPGRRVRSSTSGGAGGSPAREWPP